jgi:hypothetical protein
MQGDLKRHPEMKMNELGGKEVSKDDGLLRPL